MVVVDMMFSIEGTCAIPPAFNDVQPNLRIHAVLTSELNVGKVAINGADSVVKFTV